MRVKCLIFSYGCGKKHLHPQALSIPKIRGNAQENCVIILHITESICFPLDLDVYILFRRLRQTELPGGGTRQGFVLLPGPSQVHVLSQG